MMEFSLLLHVVLPLLFSLSLTTDHAISVSNDQLSLMSFKSHITSDPNGVLSSWNYDSIHYCNWSGVTCGRRHPERVVGLDLGESALVGSITPAIGSLTLIRTLNLSYNSFSGELPSNIGHCLRLKHLFMTGNELVGRIPSAIGNLTFLRSLVLGNNSLSGEIPFTIGRCSRLQVLDLYGNKVVGSIPSTIGNLTSLLWLSLGKNNLSGEIPSGLGSSLLKLQTLILSRNQLVGQIPPSLGNLSSLTNLLLIENNLAGVVPSSLGNLKNLQTLQLSTNYLSGTIPASIYNLTSIQSFNVYMNNLHGNLPENVAFLTPTLQQLRMFTNNFSGSIPASLCNATNLKFFQIPKNNFGGIVPPCIGNLNKLLYFDIYDNQFEAKTSKDWSFLHALTNCTSLERLQININSFEGVLPQSISNLSINLKMLVIGESDIHGTISEDTGRLTNLEILAIYRTNIDGKIPSSIGKLKSLRLLHLNENKLVGKVPYSIYNLTKITDLYLYDNNLHGEISENIRNMRVVEDILLSYNNFSGSIPKGLFNIKSSLTNLNLSNNNFGGPLPSQVGILPQLNVLDVSNNRLSDTIPASLGSCLMLTNLQLQNNLFHGIIPRSISQLKSLEALDVSRNDLSGDIPMSLAKLFSLKRLNLSYNNLVGEVPKEGVFVNASSISLVGNKGLCGGVPSLQLPPCSSSSNIRRHNIKNVTMIVLVSLTSVILLIGSIIALCFWKRKVSTKPSTTPLNRTTYAELFKATDGFSPTNSIGCGSFGSVYKGFLESIGKQVAIKVFKLEQMGGLRSFMAECEALKNIRHRNLVKILTACSSLDFEGNDFKALVYDLLPNGSLEKWLHPNVSEQNDLSLVQRLDIAIDVANAIDYLHCGGQDPIVHCDLKPSNVLLDDDMTARVADFGLARILLLNCGNDQLSETFTHSLAIKGTIGYVPPEYGVGSKVSIQGDVYSFGILLLEMVTGKRPTDDTFEEESSLHKFVESSFPEHIWDIVDAKLMIPQVEMEDTISKDNNKDKNVTMKLESCLVSMIRCGLMCAKEHPTERITMKDVVNELVMVRRTLNFRR